MAKIVSSNRLRDGAVVYFGSDDSWVEPIDAAKIFACDVEAAKALERAQKDVAQNLVIDPFLVALVASEPGRRAATLRDNIRARGPTVAYARAATPSIAAVRS